MCSYIDGKLYCLERKFPEIQICHLRFECKSIIIELIAWINHLFSDCISASMNEKKWSFWQISHIEAFSDFVGCFLTLVKSFMNNSSFHSFILSDSSVLELWCKPHRERKLLQQYKEDEYLPTKFKTSSKLYRNKQTKKEKKKRRNLCWRVAKDISLSGWKNENFYVSFSLKIFVIFSSDFWGYLSLSWKICLLQINREQGTKALKDCSQKALQFSKRESFQHKTFQGSSKNYGYILCRNNQQNISLIQ